MSRQGSETMRNFHIFAHRPLNLVQQTEQAARRGAPRHAISLLADRLKATIYEPASSPIDAFDRLGALIAPPDRLWALARRVRSAALSSDVVFCPSEGGGLQLAAVYPSGKA